MAETSVQQEICKACGVDVRPNSMFCYNCGSSVANSKANGASDVSDVWLRENIAETDERAKNDESAARVTTRLDQPVIEREKTDAGIEKEAFEKTEKTTTVQEEAKLKSAAAMRRKAKSFQQKRVEVVWEEIEDSSNVKLLLAALFLLLFAGAIVAIAFYLK